MLKIDAFVLTNGGTHFEIPPNLLESVQTLEVAFITHGVIDLLCYRISDILKQMTNLKEIVITSNNSKKDIFI